MKRKLTSLLLSLAIILSMTPIMAVQAAASITVTQFEVSDAGMLKIRGYYSNADTVDATLLILNTPVSNNIKSENFIYIDQVPLGNNGAFSYTIHISQKFSKQDAYLYLGGGGVSQKYTRTFTVPELPPDISVVDNNSTMFGRDCYYINGTFYQDADKIADSFAFGGNNIYYKIGGNWYNLLDPRASSNAFLTSKNAVSVNDIIDKVPRYYYAVVQQYTLRYYELEQEGY